MLAVISPAKSLDFATPPNTDKFSQPEFLDESKDLIKQLKHLSVTDIAQLMKLSDPLAELNHHRYQSFKPPFSMANAKQAVLAFRGDVYQGLEADTMKARDLNFAQKNLRILSGLYGLLKPLDLIQPYRLEMGTRFQNKAGKNLYEFWGNKLCQQINDELNEKSSKPNSQVLINLASNEYFKAAKAKQLKFPVITPVFKDFKNDQYKVISFFAKRARGMMSRFMIDQRIQQPDGLKDFNTAGYYFDLKSSTEFEWVFLRDEQPE